MGKDYEKLRQQMVKEQLINRGIEDQAVIDAFRKVAREKFMLEKNREYAYQDAAQSIEAGQTISQPYIVAYMTEALDLEPDEKVLEIGTGSGYQSAVLAEIASEVYTIEIIESLARKAEKTLSRLGYENVNVKFGDGYEGWEKNAPYDAIIITAAPPRVPQPLKDQLAEGGRMIIPIGAGQWNQDLLLLQKKGGELKRERLLPVRFVPMTGKVQDKE